MNISWFNACLWLTTTQVAVGHLLPKPCWTWPLRRLWSTRQTLSNRCRTAVKATALSTAWSTGIETVVDALLKMAAVSNRCGPLPDRCQSDSCAAAVWAVRRFSSCLFQASLKHNLILPNALTSLGSLRIGKSCLVIIGNSSHIQQTDVHWLDV